MAGLSHQDRSSAPPFLSVKQLSYRTGSGDVLLRDVSFDVERGAVLAIAGPNGAGKTTLLHLLCGGQLATSGTVEVDGRPLAKLSSLQRAQMIAVVSQHSAPDRRLSVRDYVALGQMPIWADRSAAEHAQNLHHVLSLTRLDAQADKPIATLSGGERQRAHIARALAQKPRLLFLDEPTNHLDPDAKGRMLSLVASLGITVVMILHDLVMIPEFASHVALIHDAGLAAFGPTPDVLTPDAVRATFGVDYLLLPHEGRHVAALDIRRSHSQLEGTPQ